MRKGSIALNLFGFSLVWLIVALALTAWLLTNLYSRSLDSALGETLEFHLETLVGVTLTANGKKIPPSSIADPRFSRPASGWYWEVRDEKGEIINFSPSLIGSVLPLREIPFDSTNMRTEVLVDGFGTNIRVIERRISFDNSTLIMTVTGNLDEIFTQVDSFRGQTLIVLGAVGIMLAVMSGIVARFALRPIDRISGSVESIRQGDATRIEGTYPREIAPLAEEVNELLRSNAQIIERARSHVGNLAHGLKTPLAVLRNESSKGDTKLAKVVRSETQKMVNIVTSYLERAQMTARTGIVGRKCDATKILQRLNRVMGKLHPQCNLEYIKPKNGSVWFRGEEGDLEEIVGNLVDNGCKWAKTKVKLSLVRHYFNGEDRLVIAVEDDGSGLSESEMELVLRRGVRLDEKTPGSGLGLDIVKELVDIYGGSLNLSKSVMGGVKVELNLPAAKPGKTD